MSTPIHTPELTDSGEPLERIPNPSENGRVKAPSGMTAPGLRVLHCISSLGGGGAERQLSYLSAELTKKGVDVHIAYQEPGPNLSRMQNSGATLHELRSRGNHDPMLLWQLIRLVRRVKPDLIQTWLLRMDVMAGLAGVLTRTPFLVTERSTAPAYEGSWKEHMRSGVGRRAALIVANSERGREYWLSRKQPGSIRVIRNCVPIEDIIGTSPIGREAQGVAGATEILLFAGRYSQEKNLSNLLDAIFLVLPEREDAAALFFGEGPMKDELIAKVRRHKLEDRVKILDYTTQLWSWMKRADLFVSVSLFEGSPNTVLEAAAQGCPLVLSGIPEHRELFGDEQVSFVSPFSADDVARGMLKVLRDPVRARQRARSAHDRVSSLTLDSITDEYLSVYSLALTRSGFMKSTAEECVGEP